MPFKRPRRAAIFTIVMVCLLRLFVVSVVNEGSWESGSKMHGQRREHNLVECISAYGWKDRVQLRFVAPRLG